VSRDVQSPSEEPQSASKAKPSSEPAPPPQRRSTVVLQGDVLIMPGNIVFEFGKAKLKEGTRSEYVLDELRLFLEEHPRITKVRIEGHTDDKGTDERNLELSGQRALTIERWLVEHGVAQDRLMAVGFGESRPIARNTTPSGRAQNRRTEFHVAALSGQPYLGRQDMTNGGTLFELTPDTDADDQQAIRGEGTKAQ
jgi:outer membrane protein OmpA-like peptidoglycan-associated protein